MKKLLLAAVLLAALITACDKPVYAPPYLMRFVKVYFRDSATGAVLIGRTGQRFLPDSVTVGSNPATVGFNYPAGYAQDYDTAGQFAVHFAYTVQTGTDESDDLTPFAFEETYYVRFNAADTDTLHFAKTAGSDVHFSWNGHFITDLPRNSKDTAVNVRK